MRKYDHCLSSHRHANFLALTTSYHIESLETITTLLMRILMVDIGRYAITANVNCEYPQCAGSISAVDVRQEMLLETPSSLYHNCR